MRIGGSLYRFTDSGRFYAFTDFKGIGSHNFIWFENFKTMWESSSDKMAILNTFKLAIPFVLLTCVLGLILALILCHNFKTKFLCGRCCLRRR